MPRSSADDRSKPLLDPATPNAARVYDYLLGGKDNFQADREAAEKGLQSYPGLRTLAWENRRFMHRAVRFLASAGIEQFVDIGSGLPGPGNVHEIAQQERRNSRVVYVDNDPVAVVHGAALLVQDSSTTMIKADLRRPEEIVGHEALRALIDLREPVGILCVTTFHYVADSDDPVAIARTLREAIAPGSYLVVTHVTHEGPNPQDLELATTMLPDVTPRSHEQIRSLFDGFTLVSPGLVRPWQWPTEDVGPRGTNWAYAGVGRKT
jgi:hypothetical protein